MHQESRYHLPCGKADISRFVALHACTNTAKSDLWAPLSLQGAPHLWQQKPIPDPLPRWGRGSAKLPALHPQGKLLSQGSKATGNPVVTAGESTGAAAQTRLVFLGLQKTLVNFPQLPTGPGLPPASAVDVLQQPPTAKSGTLRCSSLFQTCYLQSIQFS